jgi:hypothetical protein
VKREAVVVDQNKNDLENVCRDFQVASKEVLTWKWDSRFSTALAEFASDNEAKVRAVLGSFLGISWDSSNISESPDTLQMIAGRFGGLRAGQMLFAPDSSKDDFIFGVWWPWGNGSTVSIRVAPYDKRLSGAETADLVTSFKGWFDL